jgi:hypothetical protein
MPPNSEVTLRWCLTIGKEKTPIKWQAALSDSKEIRQ